MYQIGDVIRRTRESLGMTQEVLSDGICSVETLSRIENGKNVPNRANFRALMERMGKSGERYLPFLHSDDMELMEKWEEIERKFSTRNYEEVEVLLNLYEPQVDMEDRVNRQLITRLRALNDYYSGKISEKEKRDGLLRALRCTISDFDENQKLPKMLSRYEVRILCNIAVCYAEEGNLECSMEILRRVEQYILHSSMDQEERCINETLLLSNLGQVLGRNGNIEESLELNMQGISVCKENGEGERLATFLYNAGFVMDLLGKEENECKEKIIQAYYVAELCGSERRMQHIAKHWEEKYNSPLPF